MKMFHLIRIICPLLVLAALASAGAAQAATYYVATTGNDGTTCAQAQNSGTPRRTIAGGVDCLAGGDTLIFAAGTYAGQILNPPGGSAGAYTTIKGAEGGRPKIVKAGAFDRGLYCNNGVSCHYIEVRGFEFDSPYDGVKLYGTDALGYAHHINFINNIVHDTTNTALLIFSSATGFVGGDHLIQNNEFHHIGIGTPGYVPGMNVIYNPGNRTIIEGNIFHNNTNCIGIWAAGLTLQNVVIRRNRFYDIGRMDIDTWQVGANMSSAVHVSVPGGGHQIYNNLIYNSGSTSVFRGINVGARANSTTNFSIYNNTFYNLLHASAYCVLTPYAAAQIKNNIAYLAGAGFSGGTQENNLTTNPSFVDADAANFRLQSGSMAIDAGMTVPGVTVDYAGTPRPQGAAYDIGAYEGNGAGDASPAAPSGLKIQ